MLKKIITWLAAGYIEEAQKFGYNQVKEEERLARANIQQSIISMATGKKIIYCSNEWEDPIFAVVRGVTHVTKARVPMLICINVLTNENVYVDLQSFYYSDPRMVEAILKLNPFERWNLRVGTNAIASANMWSKQYAPRKPITPAFVITRKLKAVGFI